MEHLAYLLADCARMLRRDFDERVRPLGVTGQQARLLFLLERSEGDNQSAYAAQLEVEPITLCRMVDRMEDSGLISRRPDPDDRRARRLFLTPRACDMIRDLYERALGLSDNMASALTKEELANLESSLKKIHVHIQEVREQGNVING